MNVIERQRQRQRKERQERICSNNPPSAGMTRNSTWIISESGLRIAHPVYQKHFRLNEGELQPSRKIVTGILAL